MYAFIHFQSLKQANSAQFQVNISLTTLKALKLLIVYYGVLSVDNAWKNALPFRYFQQY